MSVAPCCHSHPSTEYSNVRVQRPKEAVAKPAVGSSGPFKFMLNPELGTESPSDGLFEHEYTNLHRTHQNDEDILNVHQHQDDRPKTSEKNSESVSAIDSVDDKNDVVRKTRSLHETSSINSDIDEEMEISSSFGLGSYGGNPFGGGGWGGGCCGGGWGGGGWGGGWGNGGWGGGWGGGGWGSGVGGGCCGGYYG